MEILLDILEEILEEVFELLITSPKIPKSVRYILVTTLAGFIVAIGLLLAIQSGDLIGSLLGCGLVTLGIAAGIFLGMKIHRN